MAEYRIVRDAWAGYEVQRRFWWWPFWHQPDGTNTHCSIEDAEKFAAHHAKGHGQDRKRGCVKYLGYFVPKQGD